MRYADGVSAVIALTFYQVLLRSCFLGSSLLGSCLLRSSIAAYTSVKGVKVVGSSRANLRDVVHCHILSMVYAFLLSAVVLFQLAYALLLLCLLSATNAGGSILIMPAIFIIASICALLFCCCICSICCIMASFSAALFRKASASFAPL